MKILLATDGSEYSALAARLLSCLNLSSDDEIIIFHAIFWVPPSYIDAKSYIETINHKKKEIAPRVIDATLQMLKPVRAKISTLMKEGLPEASIIDTSDDAGVDLVAMGARGIKGIKSFFIGSVTNYVAINASMPVLICKPPGCRESGKLKILFATDGSVHSVAAGALLRSIPLPVDTEITVLNVIWPAMSDILLSHVPDISEKLRELSAQARDAEHRNSRRIVEEAQAQFKSHFNNTNVLSSEGDPPTEILKIADIMKADIIVVGCKGLSVVKRIMGSVSRNVLTHSKTSVLIGKTCR